MQVLNVVGIKFGNTNLPLNLARAVEWGQGGYSPPPHLFTFVN